MKILSFSYCYPNSTSPTWGTFVEQRVLALSQRADVRVVSPSAWFPMTETLRDTTGAEDEIRNGVQVYRPRFFCVPKILKSLDGRLYSRSLHAWLEDLVTRWKPDVLDAHFAWPDGVGVSHLASQLHIPYSITLRGKIYPCLEIPAQRKQCIAALRNADQIISVDPRMAEVARDLGVPESRIEVIPNGVDTTRFCTADKVDARRELGLPQQGRLLLTVAHLGQRKGHHETIAALSQLPCDVSLVLVGGRSVSGEDEQQLRKVAQRYQVSDRLIFAGKQPQEIVPKYYQAADVTVLASWREGCPNTVLESLSCGTPVVATDVGSVKQMINEGVNGHVVRVQDEKRLAEAIDSLLRNSPIQNVRESAAVRPWSEVADDVMTTFSRLLSRSSPQATDVARDAGVVHHPTE